MRKLEAQKKAAELRAQYKAYEDSKWGKTPNFTDYRTNLPEECYTEEFKEFAAAFTVSGLEIRNIFSIYSKLKVFAPGFIKLYSLVGPIVERPTTGEWNLKELVREHYKCNNIDAIYRIIEQEKIPDNNGTARSGFEALQVVFVKGTVLGQKHDIGDYTTNDIHYENKGESGRLIGQERLFNAIKYRETQANLAAHCHTTSWEKALRKLSHDKYRQKMAVIELLQAIYEDMTLAEHTELAQIYDELLQEIPEYTEKMEVKAYCIRRASKYFNAEYGVKEVPVLDETSATKREKVCFNFVAGLMELYIYQKQSHFDILDLCEAQTGRILSFDVRNKSFSELAEMFKGKVKFYGTIHDGTRDGAHHIGFQY